jgi:NADPH2:quinone reductase
VLGAAGGVGSTAVELGKLMGAGDRRGELGGKAGPVPRARRGRDDQLQRAGSQAAIKELTGGKGVDVVYDPVGGDYAEPALRGMAWNGRYLVIGFASGDIPRFRST